MIFKIRAILDAEIDVFRDLAVSSASSLEELHHALSQSFGFDGSEMATFYASDPDWNQGQEYPIVDLGFDEDLILMRDTPIGSILSAENNKLLYVYDLLQMWTFYVELAAIEEGNESQLPQLLFSFGELPDSAPEKSFKSEKSSGNPSKTEWFEEDEFNDFEGEDLDDLDPYDSDEFGGGYADEQNDDYY